jgi:hypothetical protein
MLLAVALGAGAVFGQGHTLWQDGGVQLCGTSSDNPVAATSDSAGGAIVLWRDFRVFDALYAQRVDATGVSQWAAGGVLLSYPAHPTTLRVVDDGVHGAIAVWGTIALKAQRVSAEGVPLWGSQGLTLRDGLDQEHWPEIVKDGRGGAIVVWNALYPSMHDTLFAVRLDSSGSLVWETRVRVDTLDMAAPCACSDGEGGVVVAWYEYNGYSGHWAVRAQRVDSAGAIKWDAAGVPVCTLATVQYTQGCIAVGGSHFVAGWIDRGTGTWQTRAQMFDADGTLHWGPTGAPVTALVDGRPGGIVLPTGDARQSLWVWTENRTGTDDLFAQQLDSTGAHCWDSTGVWVGTSDTSQAQVFAATGDGRGGAIAAWPLYRNSGTWDLYAQHVDSAGHLCWSDTGLAVARDIALQVLWMHYVVTDGDGGAIVSWDDARGIFAQRVADGAGVAETMNDECRAMSIAQTVVSGVLSLPEEATSHKPQATRLLNACGREVMLLYGGANDVSGLAPGVYFVRRAQAQTVHKVVIAR